ncbi:bifunctional metallophosphatase/5'-nucleotidase [Fictibacillus barbaricus]|uniref:Bifunctional metallophosphatase/5'-nucleotidase n=1 Tax=Fictibacillus barbaricus TaxID=182136 RepID=A0ABS2ZAB4_9BACL|nr:5'-nucleotidase C-terminal domain-containing protein [Fictibacillus barbaricus]MBN3545138.1 bifunctional metallophosphatase/5'-nucleotidase [Fictibacillus barbaricus]GGB61429.1 putative metallophosphoesterase YunD [Fictibacillus barbaricus]
MKLKIIHTNDLHSNFDNFTRAATLIKQHKDEYTILLEAGDFADFKSIELQGTRGLAAVELLEAVGYDALTIGNNEMFNGVNTLEHMATHSSVPFISSNLFKQDRTNISGVLSSILLDKNGLRILITGASPDMGEFNEGLGLHNENYMISISEEIERHAGNYDLCILLNHVGTVADIDLAKEMAGIDVIVSSHDHQLFTEAKTVNDTFIVSAGNYGEYIGVLELDVDGKSKKLISSGVYPTKNAASDEEIAAILKVNKYKAIEVLKKPLYHIEQPLWHDVIGENPLTNLIADGLRDMLNCDIGLINSGIANAGIFHYVSDKKLIEVCPSPLNPTSFELQGKYIKEAVEQSLDVQHCLLDGKGPGFRGKYVGGLHVSGAKVVHDGSSVIEISIGSTLLEDEKWYTVATSDYLQRGSGYPSLANNKNEKYRAEEIKEVIKIYANKPEFVERAFVTRFLEQQNQPFVTRG